MTAAHPHDAQIRALYSQFLDGWNRRSGASVAAGFADDGDIIGFDGTHHRGRLSIAADMRANGGLITLEHLPIALGQPAATSGLPENPEAFPPGGVNLETVERDLIAKALEEAGSNRSRAARLLGITRSQLYYRMQKHGLAAG